MRSAKIMPSTLKTGAKTEEFSEKYNKLPIM
jgi:hypothetical protein